jgi:hypothetical protein
MKKPRGDPRGFVHFGGARTIPPVTRAWLLGLVAVTSACGRGSPPDLLDLTDQVAVVGQQFTLLLNGVDPDGDPLTYSWRANVEIAGRAMMTQTPSGSGVFRWTPVASDLGTHVFDFTVSDGSHDTTVSINIEVRSSAAGIPVFRQPAGTGKVVNLATDPCIVVDIVVEDEDTAQVTITEEEPRIAGAMFDQSSGTTAQWRWCPSSAQIGASDRYTLGLSADDGTNKTIKNYVLVLDGNAQRLIINEVDYDNTGVDMYEYVEIFNPSNESVSLYGLWLVFVDGATNAEYDAVYLGVIGTIPPGRYLLVGGAGVDVPAGTLKIDPGWTTEHIQNGSPDGIAIIDDITLTVLDAVSYEGSITAASIIGFPQPVSLVEGTPIPTSVADSDTVIRTLCRYPDGTDTDNAANDWTTCAVRTKASPNIK